MSTHLDALQRLREDPKQLESLADLLIDHALDRPLEALVDPAELAATVGDGLRAMAASEGLETWIEARARASTTGLEELRGPLGERIPITALAPMEKLLAREITPDPDLVRTLIDHPSLRELMREILTANLLGFARRISDMIPGAGRSGKGVGGLLGAVAKNVANAAGGAFEKQIEERARSFAEDALGTAVDSTIERMCDPKQAGEMAAWRIDVFRALLAQPVEELLDQRHKYPPRALAQDLAPLIRAFAGWSQLDAQLEAGARRVLTHHGQQTARAWLEGSGLEAGLRDRVKAQLVREGQALVGGDAFAAWMGQLLEARE